MFRNLLTYKAENAGCIVRTKNPAYTSQMCSECGHIEKENRKKQALFLCLNCGHMENADSNASKNILHSSSATVGQ
jgi:putative transposase